jgi:hypothetical protein
MLRVTSALYGADVWEIFVALGPSDGIICCRQILLCFRRVWWCTLYSFLGSLFCVHACLSECPLKSIAATVFLFPPVLEVSVLYSLSSLHFFCFTERIWNYYTGQLSKHWFSFCDVNIKSTRWMWHNFYSLLSNFSWNRRASISITQYLSVTDQRCKLWLFQRTSALWKGDLFNNSVCSWN